MIVHIVMFEFKEENKKENLQKVKTLLEELENKIDVLNTIEVGINFDTASRAMDLSLYSTFDSKEDLATYAQHEEHLKVVSVIKEVTLSSKVSDYTLD
ncbi:MAG TPA: Dabb family protein [Arcobacter sp.]|nr:Dabb family protein [Arcobacter sp.]HIP56426.1 Dabb family protein [Arcobacter sp.]